MDVQPIKDLPVISTTRFGDNRFHLFSGLPLTFGWGGEAQAAVVVMRPGCQLSMVAFDPSCISREELQRELGGEELQAIVLSANEQTRQSAVARLQAQGFSPKVIVSKDTSWRYAVVGEAEESSAIVTSDSTTRGTNHR